jgi:catechol 2,3-dioxygenase
MSSPLIGALRSVALEVPDLARAEQFYTEVWHLRVAARTADALYLRGSGADHHLLALHAGGEQPRLRKVTLRARSADALRAIAERAGAAGGRVLAGPGPLDEPGGGQAVRVADPDGRIYEVVHGDARHADSADQRDVPARLAHVVLNAARIEVPQRFLEQALGFTLADRTKIMAFMNCDRDHHSIALGDSDNDALNHIAFLMPDLDAVMRGGGRMRDAGHPVQWGPGRHGPGNNAFNYFIDPFGVVIEYTAEVEQIDDSYKVGGPGDWTWPPGRVDQWGIGAAQTPELKQAQRNVLFVPA